MSIVAFEDENVPADCNIKNVRFVSPSELSKIYQSLVIASKLKKGIENEDSFFPF